MFIVWFQAASTSITTLKTTLFDRDVPLQRSKRNFVTGLAFGLAAAVGAVMAVPTAAQRADASAVTATAAGRFAYADLADLALAAPVVVDATIRRTSRLSKEEAAGTPVGHRRLAVQANVASLIKGAGGVPAQISYLVDVPLDDRGRVPSLKNKRVLVFAAPVPGTPGAMRLIEPDAQVDWSPAVDATVRSILTESVAADPPPLVRGIGGAFHAVGTLPGESETQIFLQTVDERPVSLSILRRPGEQPRWAVALSELVDDAAAPPERNTLLWYRLACVLPRSLPARSTEQLDAAEARQVRADYTVVLAGLGPCTRERSGR